MCWISKFTLAFDRGSNDSLMNLAVEANISEANPIPASWLMSSIFSNREHFQAIWLNFVQFGLEHLVTVLMPVFVFTLFLFSDQHPYYIIAFPNLYNLLLSTDVWKWFTFVGYHKLSWERIIFKVICLEMIACAFSSCQEHVAGLDHQLAVLARSV